MNRLALAALLVFEGFCAGFFLFDLFSAALGFRPFSWQVHEMVEIGAALGLLVGILVTLRLLLVSRARAAEAEQALLAASGAFQQLLEERFTRWGLTPAERDVALFVIKGCSTQEVADLRNTSLGTVKAQTNAIYRKSGVANRAQLVSLFVEELMGDTLVPAQI